MMNNEPVIGLAVVGAGRWGQRYIATIQELPNVELRCVVSSNAATRRIVPKDCQVLDSWSSLYSRSDIDGLIIATPPATHYEIAMSAIERDMAVVIEKPMTLNRREAENLYLRAKEHGALVLVGHTHLFSPAYWKLKEVLAGLGRVIKIVSCGANHGPVRSDTPMMWDYAPHDIAMCLDLLGEKPSRVHATRSGVKAVCGANGESVTIGLDFPGNIRADISVSNIADRKHRRFEVETERGTLIYDDTASEKLQFRGVSCSGMETLSVYHELPLTRFVLLFVQAIRSNKMNLDSVRLGRDVVDVLTRCQAALVAK